MLWKKESPQRGANVTCNYASSLSPLFDFYPSKYRDSILSQTLFARMFLGGHFSKLFILKASIYSLWMWNIKQLLNWPHGAPGQMEDLPSPWDHNVGREKRWRDGTEEEGMGPLSGKLSSALPGQLHIKLKWRASPYTCCAPPGLCPYKCSFLIWLERHNNLRSLHCRWADITGKYHSRMMKAFWWAWVWSTYPRKRGRDWEETREETGGRKGFTAFWREKCALRCSSREK